MIRDKAASPLSYVYTHVCEEDIKRYVHMLIIYIFIIKIAILKDMYILQYIYIYIYDVDYLNRL